MLDGIENVFKKGNEQEFTRFAQAFSEREKPLDGKCTRLVTQGCFPKYAMEQCKFLHMAGEHGAIRIVIEYDADKGIGWKRITREED